ncbi:hypothetical protein [Pandoraea capi]|uniref:hypothetical protein n=1 Tax=Pandoraea capi TaxID=2508286 RepID=UPI001583140C|nr:hypothetical protein [Pandoraea capi]
MTVGEDATPAKSTEPGSTSEVGTPLGLVIQRRQQYANEFFVVDASSTGAVA